MSQSSVVINVTPLQLRMLLDLHCIGYVYGGESEAHDAAIDYFTKAGFCFKGDVDGQPAWLITEKGTVYVAALLDAVRRVPWPVWMIPTEGYHE